MTEAVIVAVRCRPFNKREVAMDAKVIVSMTGAKTTLIDPSGQSAPRDFTFDYSYWSFDKAADNFCDNPKVYSDLGVSVLNNAWSGYNCCLFAYGQTGSGKSYSMVGYGDDRGIVPQAMEELFTRIKNNKDPNMKFMVEASMMEIYNEKVRDLFNPESEKNHINGLKIRDHPQTGPYVEDLSRCLIKTFPEFANLLEDGNRVRTVAATQMNATSSRAHTVFQIVLTVTTHDVETNKDSNRTAKINLVDLAGSERVSKTGASGQQLKEGIGINKSLTSLGNCIEKLAKKSSGGKGKKDEVHVPYRDSVLTWLLKESLGGNAKTIMIAAISPADDNYEESLSTLRYADRAKQIKNSAIINEDENAKIIRELKKEIQALRDALARGGGGGGPGSSMTDQEKEEYLALKEKMKENEDIVKRMNMSWEEKMKESEDLAFKRAAALHMSSSETAEKKKKIPHMVNLHKDKMMSECLTYFFPVGKEIRLCTQQITPPPQEDDIILSGLQIKPDHGRVKTDSGSVPKVFITASKDARVFVNGQPANQGEPKELNHNDRVILGAHLVFRVILPNHASDDSDSQFDWEFANKELTNQAIESINSAEAEKAKEQEEKLKKMQAEVESEKRKAKEAQEAKEREYQQMMEDLAKKKEEEFEKARRELELTASSKKAVADRLNEQLAAKEAELERERQQALKLHNESMEKMRREQEALQAKLKSQMDETAALQKKHDGEKKDRAQVEENLMRMIPLVNEGNAICTELAQPLRFAVKLEVKKSKDGFVEKTNIMVRVANLENHTETMWDEDTLNDVLFQMREIYSQYMRFGNGNPTSVIPKNADENPFHFEVNGPTLIGSARIILQACFYLLPIEETVTIIDYKGDHKGHITVAMKPVPESYLEPLREDMTKSKTKVGLETFFISKPPPSEDDLIFEEEDLTQLDGQPFHILFEIPKLTGLPRQYCKNVFVRYKFASDLKDMESPLPLDKAQRNTPNPLLDYKRLIEINSVDDDLITTLKDSVLEINIFGEMNKDDLGAEKRGSVISTGSPMIKRGSLAGSTSFEKRGSVSGSDLGSYRSPSPRDLSSSPSPGGFNSPEAQRIQELETILGDIGEQFGFEDISAETPKNERQKIIMDKIRTSPQVFSRRAREITQEHRALRVENTELRSPLKQTSPNIQMPLTPMSPATNVSKDLGPDFNNSPFSPVYAKQIEDENRKMKEELESLRRSQQGTPTSKPRSSDEAELRQKEQEVESLRKQMEKMKAEMNSNNGKKGTQEDSQACTIL